MNHINSKNISKYCLSHGACTHYSKYCNTKISGQKYEYTFCDNMGGIKYEWKRWYGMEEQIQSSLKCINVIKNSCKHTFWPSTTIPPVQPLPSFITVKGYIAASNNYWIIHYLDSLINVKTEPGPTVTLPDMITITATQQGQLPLSSIILTQAAVLNDLHSSSRISFCQPCDDNCKVISEKRHCYVMKDGYLILQVKVSLTDGFWDITLPVQKKYVVPKLSKYQYFTVFQSIPEHLRSVVIRKQWDKNGYSLISTCRLLQSCTLYLLQSHQ